MTCRPCTVCGGTGWYESQGHTWRCQSCLHGKNDDYGDKITMETNRNLLKQNSDLLLDNARLRNKVDILNNRVEVLIEQVKRLRQQIEARDELINFMQRGKGNGEKEGSKK